jgi:hypothetical protein
MRADAVRWALSAATVVSFVLVLQNFALDIFPDQRVHIPPELMRPYSSATRFAYVFDYDGSEPDLWPSTRSRVSLTEDGQPYNRLRNADEVILVGGNRFTHEPGRIVFSSYDNTDPRTNGRSYDLTTPTLYLPAIGDSAMAVFLGCAVAWYFLCRNAGPPTAAERPGVSRWRWHLLGATLVFILGIYCNTGSLAPYAITSSPTVDPSTGYAYNQDHPHFRVLFDFVDGKDRKVWDKAQFLRRILYPVLAWPLMKLLGFEPGGVLTSFILNAAGFVAALILLRRWVGERAAIFSGWLLALYPAAAYWGGLPYTHALIFPSCLFLMLGLMRLSTARDAWSLAAVSLAMGVVYLGYDLGLLYIPAAVIVLCWRRRPLAAAASAIIQAAPIAIWMGVLTWVLHQPLQNRNSSIFSSVFSVYVDRMGLAWWWQRVVHLPDYGFDIFFASNFIFIPALFLVVLVLNPLTSRIGFRITEVALLASGLALYLFLNLAPNDASTWPMRGTWIARIYQPIFPALVLYMARWWQDLPPLSRPWRILVVLVLAATSLGNALVLFGPILDDPGGISKFAFYQFYDHTAAHFLYAANRAALGRRPIGFPRDMRAVIHEASPEEILAQKKALMDQDLGDLRGIRGATEDNVKSLMDVEKAFRQVGRALAEARSAIYARKLAISVGRGEITATDAKRQAKGVDDFVWPELRKVLDDPSLDLPPAKPAPGAEPGNIPDMNAALVADSKKLVEVQREVSQAQGALGAAEADLASAEVELGRLDKEEAAKPAH